MKGIPVEQRGLRTIAKIGGLVGKTLIIDESTRFNRDYIRMKIACRNIDLVPPSAECSLGLFLYNFFFERETPTDDSHDKLQTQVDVGDEGQPSPKKPITTPPSGNSGDAGCSNLVPQDENNRDGCGNFSWKANLVGGPPFKLTKSAPSKLNTAMHTAASKLGFNKDPAPDAPQKSSSSDKLSREEAIPVATYEPSGDLLANDFETESDTSCDYETEVLKAIGADAEPSQGGANIFLASCIHAEPPNLVKNLDAAKITQMDLSTL